jgi:hypothetical protein
MKLSQLIENFVISNDEFEDYLNRSTEQLMQELQSGKNPRDAVHELALTFADQHNKSYDAYTRMSDSLSARMHTLELGGSTSTEIAPTDMTNGPEMSDMGAEPEMMTDPMGDMEMETPAQDEMPGDSDMEDYAAVMDNEPEVEESVYEGTKGCADCDWIKDETDGDIDTCDECAAEKRKTNEASDEDEKARQRAFAKADEPERGEKPKKVSLKKAPWEESVNEAKASVLDQLQSIVDDKQAKSIKFDDGSSKVDMFTASAITQVYAKVNDDNKAKIEKMLNTRTGLMKIAKVAMGALKEGKLDEILPAVGAVAGGVARVAGGVAKAAMSKGIKGAVTRAGIKGVANKVSNNNEANDIADRIMRTSSRQSFSEYNEFYKELDSAAKAGKKAGDTISVGGKQIKLKSAPKPMDQLSDAEMDRIDALAIRLSEMDR